MKAYWDSSALIESTILLEVPSSMVVFTALRWRGHAMFASSPRQRQSHLSTAWRPKNDLTTIRATAALRFSSSTRGLSGDDGDIADLQTVRRGDDEG